MNVQAVECSATRRSVAGTAVGNFMESYDFGLYSLIATTLAQTFYPDGQSGTGNLIATFGTLAAAFVVRPFGGFIFGPLGDRIGRKPVLLITIGLMTVSATATGLLPGYATVGNWAPILLVIVRVCQGLSTGGEYAGAMTYIDEQAPHRRRGMLAGFLPMGTLSGYLAGAVLVTGLQALLPAADMLGWGWRIPFLLAAPLGLVALALRLRLDESREYRQQRDSEPPLSRRRQIRLTVAGHWKALLVCIGLEATICATSYMLSGYLPTYLKTVVRLPGAPALLMILAVAAGHAVQVLKRFYEEYARADAPDKVNHFGEELLGPTLIAFGTPEQQQRFLPRILDVTELWCQGYSEPGAGSDLANVSTTAELDGDQWVINGQKVWTSLAHLSQWCFVVARTEKGSKRHTGLSYLLVPLDQPGVQVRPIVQITGTAEFNEVFFDDARTDASLVVGQPGDGWRVAMGTLTFERGVSTLGQQIVYARELSNLAELAQRNGAAEDPFIRERLTRAWTGLRAMRSYALATMDVEQPGQDNVSKLLWANWHRALGELAMDVIGKPGMTLPNSEFDEWQRLFLFTRADTIYGGSNEIQRNIIAERVLGLPREVKG